MWEKNLRKYSFRHSRLSNWTSNQSRCILDIFNSIYLIPSIMSDSQIDVEDAIAQTIIAICNAVLSRKLDASKEVLAHITSTPLYQIIDQMQQAMCHDVGDILEGCGNDFVDLKCVRCYLIHITY